LKRTRPLLAVADRKKRRKKTSLWLISRVSLHSHCTGPPASPLQRILAAFAAICSPDQALLAVAGAGPGKRPERRAWRAEQQFGRLSMLGRLSLPYTQRQGRQALPRGARHGCACCLKKKSPLPARGRLRQQLFHPPGAAGSRTRMDLEAAHCLNRDAHSYAKPAYEAVQRLGPGGVLHSGARGAPPCAAAAAPWRPASTCGGRRRRLSSRCARAMAALRRRARAPVFLVAHAHSHTPSYSAMPDARGPGGP
jgi:hypothetical protein